MQHPELHRILSEVEQARRAAHPLFTLVKATDSQGLRRADALNDAVGYAREHFKDFAEAKLKTIVCDLMPRNIVGAFGELRALRDLARVWPRGISTPSSGADFEIIVGDRQLKVEVTTPSGASNNTTELLESTNREGVIVEVSSIIPFGFPTDDKPGDTIQGNAISRLAALKQEEHQADESVPSILWVDLDNHEAFPLSIGAEQAHPLVGGPQEIISGALWWMNYGREGDPIFDRFELATHSRSVYELGFNARFERGSKFVGTISSINGLHLFHQNHRTVSRLDPMWITELAQLYGAKFEDWWVDWPSAGSLAARVYLARQSAIALSTKLWLPDGP